MTNVVIMASQMVRILLFVALVVLVACCLVGVWMLLGRLIYKALWGYSFQTSKKNKIIILSSWGAYIIGLLFGAIFGISFIIVGLLDGIWWFYICAALLLLILPGIAALILNEYLDRRKRR